jgi:hypothetical protein
MLKRIVLLFFPILFLGFWNSSFAQESEDDNAKIKAVFIYNFTKYIEWPNIDQINTFKIGIYDNSTLLAELQKMANFKKINDVKFEVIELQSLKQIDKSFNILFLNDKKKFPLGSIYSAIGDHPILAVTDSYNEDQVMIDFRIVGERQRFALNVKELEKQGLKVASVLEKLATPIQSTWSYSRNSDNTTKNADKVESKDIVSSIDEKASTELKETTPRLSNEKYDAIIAQMQAELGQIKK